MPPVEAGRRKAPLLAPAPGEQQARARLQRAVLRRFDPIVAVRQDRGRAQAFGLPQDHGPGGGQLRSNGQRHPLLDDPGLFEGDLLDAVAQVLLVVVGDGGDDADGGLADHVGGVQPPAEPDFQQQQVGATGIRLLREGEEGGGGGDLEEGDGLAAVRLLANLQQRGEPLLGDQAAGKADALVKAHQVG